MNEKTKVYISGPITGMPDDNRQDFQDAEDWLKYNGYSVVNPHRLNHKHGKTWGEYLRVDIIAMMESCDKIYLLDGWTHSDGARIEYNLAKGLGFSLMGPGLRE